MFRKSSRWLTPEIITIMVMLVLWTAQLAKATVVDICTATNKLTYLLGEEVVVFVIAYNPNPEPVTLTFPTSMQVSYLMDNTYGWKYHHGSWPEVTEQRIEGFSPHTWTLVHGVDEMETYLPMLGTHTIVGEVLGYGQSALIEFDVVPEPATILFIGLGSLILRRNFSLSNNSFLV